MRRATRATLGVAVWLCLSWLGAAPAHAATFTIINGDDPGEGFNDFSTRAPVGGNSGTTLGQQRLNAFQHAADLWGAVVQSTQVIRISAKFDSLPCESNSATLGQAGPTGLFAQFTGVPLANTWYPSALANAVAFRDLDPSKPDIDAVFNKDLDDGCFMGAKNGWYYGFDNNPPEGKSDFALTALHELGHGLGIIISTNVQTGAKLNGFDDVYMRNLEDHVIAKMVPDMSNAERAAAFTRTGSLHWLGAQVQARSSILSAGRDGTHVRIYAPSTLAPGSSVSHFDTSLTPDELMEPFVTVDAPRRDLATAMLADIGWGIVGSTSTPTFTRTPTPTRTLTHTQTVTPTLSATLTRTVTQTPTITLTPSRTVTPTRTASRTPTPADTATPTQTLTPTRTSTPSPTGTPSLTATTTPTAVPTDTRTPGSPTATVTETETPLPSNTPTRTQTPEPPSPTPPFTETPVPTETSPPATETPLPSPTSSPTDRPSPTPPAPPTPTPSVADDANCDGAVSAADAVASVAQLGRGGDPTCAEALTSIESVIQELF